MQTNYVAPLKFNFLFYKALKLFAIALQRSKSVEFRVKTGILTFGNGVVGIEGELADSVSKMYLSCLV